MEFPLHQFVAAMLRMEIEFCEKEAEPYRDSYRLITADDERKSALLFHRLEYLKNYLRHCEYQTESEEGF